MQYRVSDYLAYFKEYSYEELFDLVTLHKLEYIQEEYGEVVTEETILETCISKDSCTCDYSIRVDTDSEVVKEYWYELDSENCKENAIAPCYFIDASAVQPQKNNEAFYQDVLVRLAGKERVVKLMPVLKRCVAALQDRSAGLYQIGAMTGREQMDSLRLFTDYMRKEAVLAYLKEIGWGGDFAALEKWLAELESFSDRKLFIIDFDIYEEGISEKLGINLGTRNHEFQTMEEWLGFLEEKGLCLPQKKAGIMKFIRTFPSHTPFIQNDVSHFKLPFEKGRVTMAKAYLRQGGKCVFTEYKAYASPTVMNLELTTRCPLHCPQCYCDLNRGTDMELETALYWIQEAAVNKVKTVNLSGGETLCYPHLTELIKACHSKGMHANIAISGCYFTRDVAEKLIENGVFDICVSLNGSSEEINQKSRDGYEAAIRALEILKELEFKRTCINWVMHSFNADDFEQMIRLAEEYQVSTLVVMVFKPDASNQLLSVPSKEQILQVAGLIKKYQGPVSIEIEECFSQMRAVVGERFFINKNVGIEKGCGAGRDGISISADGKLTPCRHLEVKEEWDTIQDYWNRSEFLKKLRQADEKKEEPCHTCKYQNHCLPCMAVNWKMKNKIFMGEDTCPFAK